MSCQTGAALDFDTHHRKVRAVLPEPSLEPLEFVLGGDVTAVVVGISGIRLAVLRRCPGGGGRRREEGRHGCLARGEKMRLFGEKKREFMQRGEIGRGKRRPTQTKSTRQTCILVTSTTLNGTTPTRVSRTMSDTGSDYTEQTGMVSELTLEREMRRERPAAQAAAADPAAAAAAAPTPPRAAGVTHEYRGGVEESKEIPEEEVEEEVEEEEDLVGDEDDEIESSISQRQQQQGRSSHKSAVDALASPDEQSTTTASSAGTGTGGESSVQREKIRAAALKARRASSRAVQSVVKYERDHQLVQTTWAGIRQGVRYAGRKVRECTSVDTTATPSGDGGK